MRINAPRRLARTVWKVTVVILLTITVMWAVGELIQVLSGTADDTATTEER